MKSTEMNVVTGAFSYTGKYIAQRLLSMGKTVRTITGHPDRNNPFMEQVEAFPFNFDNPKELTRSLEGATTVYNTYWTRFPYGGPLLKTPLRAQRRCSRQPKRPGFANLCISVLPTPP